MTRRALVIVGAGGFARETVELVAAINAGGRRWDLHGFVDDDPSRHGTVVCGLPVLGGSELVASSACAVVVCVGSPRDISARSRVVSRLDLDADRYATLVHPTAVLPRSVDVGHGTVIHALTVATGWATIGSHVAVMPGCVVTHDDSIGDFATVAAGVRFAGDVHVGPSAYVGAGALVRESLRIGAGSLVGMGAVVTRDVPPGEVWAGAPARCLRPVSR